MLGRGRHPREARLWLQRWVSPSDHHVRTCCSCCRSCLKDCDVSLLAVTYIMRTGKGACEASRHEPHSCITPNSNERKARPACWDPLRTMHQTFGGQTNTPHTECLAFSISTQSPTEPFTHPLHYTCNKPAHAHSCCDHPPLPTTLMQYVLHHTRPCRLPQCGALG